MNFSEALNHIKEGKRVSREGWNGKGMFIYLVDGSVFTVNRAPLNKHYADGTTVTYLPHIDMRTADGSLTTWVASQADLLSNDWFLSGDFYNER